MYSDTHELFMYSDMYSDTHELTDVFGDVFDVFGHPRTGSCVGRAIKQQSLHEVRLTKVLAGWYYGFSLDVLMYSAPNWDVRRKRFAAGELLTAQAKKRTPFTHFCPID